MRFVIVLTLYLVEVICPTTRSATVPPITTPRITTVPGGCFYEGKIYHDGQDIRGSVCGGLRCDKGNILNWDDACVFFTPPCLGQQMRIPGQCCPVCLTSTAPPTTTRPTTTPMVPPGGCVIGNKSYANGEYISRAEDNCFGTICHEGHQLAWDHACFFSTPPCSGVQEKLRDKCCPVCHNVTTTPPSLTSTKQIISTTFTTTTTTSSSSTTTRKTKTRTSLWKIFLKLFNRKL
ncbi:hypothetical protein MAR_012096 [Mya arenaria]|uniref:Uncharacterized protein n=1 Tax=Mya arenaria TaxID=6604 RepID=A0ABY7FW45_MYAAR|nr:cysteine-rich motor neuron 1 protein-like [Mya arenaria]WAR26392.1 hypothetical protein MAR_012096 [Mya arenaria]